MPRFSLFRWFAAAAFAFMCAQPAVPLHAQNVASRAVASDTLTVTLELALARALGQSEEIRLARAGADAARQQVGSARAGLFPQARAQLSYQRTIRSPINTGRGFALPDSLQFAPDSTASLSDRIRYLETNVPNAALSSLGSLFSGLPFGQKNTWVATLSLQQTVFSGEVFAGMRIAREFERLAEAQVTEAQQDLVLQVIEAYYDAVLADRLADIAAASTTQLDAQLSQVRLIQVAGNASNLDVLRVEVERRNLEPQRVAALNSRDVALLDLKRLINLPIEQPIILTDDLQSDAFRPVSARQLDGLVESALARRATVQAAERQVLIRAQQVDLAKAAYLPSLALTANVGRQALPSAFLPAGSDFRDDWNIGAAIQIPIFSGGRRRAEVELARVQLRQSQLQLAQLREAVSLDVAQQRGELARAAALLEARARTTEQADTVYSLTRLAYDRGLQTNLQLSDARLQLQQARANEAQALHAYYVSLARLLRATGRTPEEFATLRTHFPNLGGGR